MRILLVLDRVENPASANALMGFRLAEQLLRRDHTVHILTLWDGLHTPPAPPEGAMQHLLAFADERQMNEALENGQKGGTPVPLRLARLAAHPAAAAAAFRQLVLKQPRRTVDSRREIERLYAEFYFDAVCAVCAPYRTAFALEAAAIRGKKFLWQLDPYASNRDYTAPGGFARGTAAGRAGRDLRHAAGPARLRRRRPAGPVAGKGTCSGLSNAAAAGHRAGGTRRYTVCFLRQPAPRHAGARLCTGAVPRTARRRCNTDDGGRRLGAL